MIKNGTKVLLVDDESGILDTLKILFGGEGFDVRVAATGREAMTALEKDRPDLVVTDIRMPGASGLEGARARAPSGSGAAGDPDDGSGVASVGGPGRQRGRLLLSAEAFRQR